MLVTFRLTGAQIKSVLEDALSFFLDDGGGTASYPVSAGLRWDVDMLAPRGGRVTNIEVNKRLEEEGEWTPLDLYMTYMVATNSFLADGRDGYSILIGTIDRSVEGLYENS